ncbi:MAG: hypothetical protein V3T73_02740 [Dehalococcoidales bacterium]|jgi:hypothetical protein
MTTTILIVGLVFLLGLGLGTAIIWYVLRHKKVAKVTKKDALAQTPTRRWKYVALPLVILFLSLALTAYFYRLLPAEVAWRFSLDGSPKSWLSRQAVTLVLLAPQFFLTLAAAAFTWGIVKLGYSYGQMGGLRQDKIILLMGNIVALPQVVILFVMLDIFSYNVYDLHLMPTWMFALIVMVVGGVFLAIFFIKAFIRLSKPADSTTQQKP